MMMKIHNRMSPKDSPFTLARTTLGGEKAFYWIILRKQKTDGDEYFSIDALNIYKYVNKSNNAQFVITMGHMHIITANSQKGKMAYITH